MKLFRPRLLAAPSTALFAALVLALLAGTAPALAQTTDTAVYKVRFQSAWSVQTHPQGFPPNPHFSGLIGGVHGPDVVFWEEGGVATAGMEEMAERGQITPLDTEVQAAIDGGTALQVITGGGIAVSPGSAQAFFTVHRDHPLVTLVSMVAPSPDWFVGVSGLSMAQSGEWLTEQVVTLFAWDSGTDSGSTFTSSDADTQPRGTIERIVDGPLGNGVPLGTFTFTRQDTPEPNALLLQGGRFRVTAEWADTSGTRGLAMPTALTDDTGYFWFFDQDNVEAVIKVLDGCAINGHYWVFAGGLTDVEVTLVVEDSVAGVSRTFENPLGLPFQPIQNTGAFATCP